MSAVIGRWVIDVQDAMPEDLRNSDDWKAALVRAAGTGRNHERERLDIILEWMWTTALPSLQPLADEYRLGEQWRQMCIERSVEVALATGVATAGPLAASARAAASAVYLAAHGDVFTVQ